MTPFDLFWAAYPRKVGKAAARFAFAKALRVTTLETMLSALAWQRTQPTWAKDGGTFIPHPKTWLVNERWEDEPFQPITQTTRQRELLQAIERGERKH